MFSIIYVIAPVDKLLRSNNLLLETFRVMLETIFVTVHLKQNLYLVEMHKKCIDLHVTKYNKV